MRLTSRTGNALSEYFTGVFDGTRFVADSNESKWVDYGRDFYAPVSWSDIPESDGRRIWIGWMNNWQTAENPTYPWRGAMSVPREVTLRRIGDELRLIQRPIRELKTLAVRAESLKDISIDGDARKLATAGQQLKLTLDIDPGTASVVGLRVLKNGDEQTEIGYDVKSKHLCVDRTRSGNVAFHSAFAGRHSGPLSLDADGRIHLTVLVDASSVEVFGGHGETVITDLVFPSPESRGIELFATGGKCRVVSCDVETVSSIWFDEVEQR